MTSLCAATSGLTIRCTLKADGRIYQAIRESKISEEFDRPNLSRISSIARSRSSSCSAMLLASRTVTPSAAAASRNMLPAWTTSRPDACPSSFATEVLPLPISPLMAQWPNTVTAIHRIDPLPFHRGCCCEILCGRRCKRWPTCRQPSQSQPNPAARSRALLAEGHRLDDCAAQLWLRWADCRPVGCLPTRRDGLRCSTRAPISHDLSAALCLACRPQTPTDEVTVSAALPFPPAFGSGRRRVGSTSGTGWRSTPFAHPRQAWRDNPISSKR